MKSRTRGPRHLNLSLSQVVAQGTSAGESPATDAVSERPRLRLDEAEPMSWSDEDSWPVKDADLELSVRELELSVREAVRIETETLTGTPDDSFADSLDSEATGDDIFDFELPEHGFGHSWDRPPVVTITAPAPTYIADAASEGLTQPGPVTITTGADHRNDYTNEPIAPHYSLSFEPSPEPPLSGAPSQSPDQTLAEISMTEPPKSDDPAPETPAPLAVEIATGETDAFGDLSQIMADEAAQASASFENDLSNDMGDEALFAESDPTPGIIKAPKLHDTINSGALGGASGKTTAGKNAGNKKAFGTMEDEILLDEPLVTPPPRPSTPAPSLATSSRAQSAFADQSGNRSQKNRSKSQTPAKAQSTQLAKRPGPGGVLQLSNSSGVTYWGSTAVISLTWVGGLVAAFVGSETGLALMSLTWIKLALMILLAVLPLGLIFATAYALRHASRLAIESARAAQMADSLVGPAAAAAADTATLVAALRDQVDLAVSAVRLAHAEVTEMGLKLKSETELLHASATNAQATTRTIADTLSSEREAITRVGQSLDAQAKGVIESVDLQARMVADASDLAQAQLREAEASLTARAADLSVAAAEVQETARTVAEDLDRQTQRLESAGAGVADQIKIVEDGLSQQRAGLVSASLSLRADQEDFAVHLETQRAQLGDALSVTRGAMVELGDASSRGVDLLREIVIAAQDQLRQVLSAAENERTSFETRIHSTLDNISVMAADARDELVNETRQALDALNAAAEDARKAADSAAASAQSRVERLNESVFEAGKKADEVFDSRLSSARRLIEDSAALIDEAGSRTASRLDEGFIQTRDTIREVSEALKGLNVHAEGLPALAQERIAEIRQTVEDGIRAMTEAARLAAQETEAVDQGFQERVRRNYDMLSEAVRMMGILSGPAASNAASAPPQGSNTNGLRDRARDRETPPRIADSRQDRIEPASREPQARDRDRDPTPRSGESRGNDYGRAPEAPRDSRRSSSLNEPLSHSQPSKSVPPQLSQSTPPAGSSSGRGTEPWSWSDLLKGMEGRGVAADPERQPDQAFDNLDDMMIHEISGMGIDAASLLGRTRMDETIAAILAEDNEGARLAVRRIAPAAVRRLTRRFVTDTQMRDLASQFIAFYDRQINVALLSNDARVKLHEILANDTGRAYLLIDAAISDII